MSQSSLHLDTEGAGVAAPARHPAHRAVREAPAARVLEAGRRARARRARVVSLQQHRARQPGLTRPRPRLATRTRVVRHALLGHAHALLGQGHVCYAGHWARGALTRTELHVVNRKFFPLQEPAALQLREERTRPVLPRARLPDTE